LLYPREKPLLFYKNLQATKCLLGCEQVDSWTSKAVSAPAQWPRV